MRRAALILALSALPAAAEPVALSVDRPFGALHGTLETAPGPARAAAVILPGSGPTDRDGNSPLGLRTDAYRLLAEALAAQGIATLRIDKRGIGASAGDPDAVSLAAYRADTEAWIAAIRAETGAPCAWLIGHSEGGLLALDAAGLPGVCGLVLLAAPGRDLGALMRDQVAQQPALAPALPAFETALAALVETGAPDTAGLPPPLAAIFGPATRGYLRELVTTDPAALLAATDLPVLILDGDADIQVPPSEGDRLAAARPDAPRITLPGMTHTLKRAAPADDSAAALTAASLATYADPSLPLHDVLVPAIAGVLLAPR
ncbi:alpha/beta hydrolase [Roseicyclus persicicus]|uniref:Alpha/beta hydrolase n=1 Tax=Roseicyclus persicicus TaxID=2650661 RepID=A0A7X6JY95_9RHOB|nr:alpha/beta fold hydrolase [Roseibacterium persicicum]NKX44219.1 alpha/beta hydrolase [Roseibacterium persicicum]